MTRKRVAAQVPENGGGGAWIGGLVAGQRRGNGWWPFRIGPACGRVYGGGTT